MKSFRKPIQIILLTFIIIASFLAFLPHSGAAGRFSINNSQTLNYTVTTDAPSLYPYKHYAITVISSNSSGVFANVTVTNQTNGKENFTNLQYGWNVNSSDTMGSQVLWSKLMNFEFLIFPQNIWDEIQRFMFNLEIQMVTYTFTIIKIQDDFIPFLGAIRWIKRLQFSQISRMFYYVWPDFYTEVNESYYHFEFDFSGILIRFSKISKFYNITDGYYDPFTDIQQYFVSQDSVEYILIQTSASLSIAIPPLLIYLIVIGAITIGLFVLIIRSKRVKPKKREFME